MDVEEVTSFDDQRVDEGPTADAAAAASTPV